MTSYLRIGWVLLLAACCTQGQGTFIYDQQSSTYEVPPAYGSGPAIQGALPSTGQSFTPSLSGVDFIRLTFNDGDLSDGLGATIYLNLRSTSITGPVLGTTAPVSMPNGFSGVVNFFFPNTVSLAPATVYYFDLGLQSGGTWNVDVEGFHYPGGEAFKQGSPYPGSDYWFREGLYVVPEPSPAVLSALGGALLGLLRRCRSVTMAGVLPRRGGEPWVAGG